jgi:nucleotide-binding universal stress UspA family protein
MVMKTILAFVGGGERDAVILETAAAAALPLSAHIDCFHAHVPFEQAARYAHLDYAAGDGLKKAIHRLQTNSSAFSRLAGENVRAFCERVGIEMCDGGSPAAEKVTARFFEEASNDPKLLVSHASQRDMIVMGRLRQKQGLAPDTLENMVRHSGRPVLVAANAAARSLTDTIMVCWKDAGHTAGVVTAARPLLAAARRVLFVSVAKHEGNLAAEMTAAARDLAGISNAEAQIVSANRGGVPEALAAAADECDATLLVTGAYGRSRGKEILFGSCTDKLLERCDRPILLKH